MSSIKRFLCPTQKSDIDLKAAVQFPIVQDICINHALNKSKVDNYGVFKVCSPDKYDSDSDVESNHEFDSLDDNLSALYNAINTSLDNKFEAKFDEKFDKFKNDVHSSARCLGTNFN